MPVASPPEPRLLIAAQSARSLAQAARRAGYRPLAADLFGDLDTRAAAEAFEPSGGDFATGFDEESLLAALDRLGTGRDPVGVITGSGFERRPELLDRIASHWPLLGNGAAAVAAVKDPFGFAAACRRLGLPHPAVALLPGAGHWLSKETGGAGGGHIRFPAGAPATGRYFQRHVDGLPVSALVLGDGRRARVLGWSRQWCQPAPDEPFRYGGAVAPPGLAEARLEPLAEAAVAITMAFGLKGLVSADFLIAEKDWHLIEVNPRPGAALDVFPDPGGLLIRAHVTACAGSMPDLVLPAPATATVAAVAYATRTTPRIPAIIWPDFAHDRQPPGSAVPAGAPLATVTASAATPVDAIAAVQARIHLIRHQLETSPA